MPDDIEKITNILKLLLKILLPTIDDSESEKTEVSSVITVKEDGRRFKVTCVIEPE